MTNPDHHYHGHINQILGVRRSSLAAATADPRDASLYREAFDESIAGEMLLCHSARRAGYLNGRPDGVFNASLDATISRAIDINDQIAWLIRDSEVAAADQ